jgi:integrase
MWLAIKQRTVFFKGISAPVARPVGVVPGTIRRAHVEVTGRATIADRAVRQRGRSGPCSKRSMATGCRQGEIQALRWSAVDLARGTASIKASVRAGRRKRTKTESGERLLHLPPYLVDMLTRYKSQRRIVRLDKDDPVFATWSL